MPSLAVGVNSLPGQGLPPLPVGSRSRGSSSVRSLSGSIYFFGSNSRPAEAAKITGRGERVLLASHKEWQ